jgi:predicted nucleic acid-binding protein
VGVEDALRSSEDLCIPVIALGEFRFGILHSRSRARYQQWLSELIGTCRVLSVDARTAEHYAAIRAELKKDGHPIPENDIWIAAIARQHAMPVLSRDHHFDAVGGLTRVGW